MAEQDGNPPPSTETRFSGKREMFNASRDEVGETDQSGRQLFEACRTGDVSKVTSLIENRWSVNMRDTAGRKSTPLHFAAGKNFLMTPLIQFYRIILLAL